MRAVVLLSGGLDSYTAAGIARADGFELYALTIAYGEAELPELQRQSREFYTAWHGAGLPGQLAPIAGRHHFSILDELHRPEGALTAAVCRLVDRPPAS